MLLRVVAEPMFLLLCVAVALYVLLGELREALVLATSLVAVVVISASQERRAERALEALRDLSSPRAAVLRDGELRRIAGREVVRGDIVMLAEGDRVPADGVLLESIDLEIDESLLTGESLPAPKRALQAGADASERRRRNPACIPEAWSCAATPPRKSPQPVRARSWAGSARRLSH